MTVLFFVLVPAQKYFDKCFYGIDLATAGIPNGPAILIGFDRVGLLQHPRHWISCADDQLHLSVRLPSGPDAELQGCREGSAGQWTYGRHQVRKNPDHVYQAHRRGATARLPLCPSGPSLVRRLASQYSAAHSAL
ncbi:hypothetical protein MRX96_005090 [Rhipicephalus microplus]